MLPAGWSGISVEQQQFECEVRDADGKGYFRAPDHFAARLLAIPGFAIAASVPEGAPEDLPRADPLRDGAIAELSKGNEALRMEVTNLRSDLVAANAKIKALETANNTWAELVKKKDAAIAELEEQIEDKPRKAKAS